MSEVIRVLVVDDHPVVRGGLVGWLDAQPDLTVVGEAGDGQAAVELASELHPDLVLLDVNLPDIDGFDVASRLTGAEDSPTVILVSSRDPSDFGPLVGRSGAKGFIPKGELSGEALTALLA